MEIEESVVIEDRVSEPAVRGEGMLFMTKLILDAMR